MAFRVILNVSDRHYRFRLIFAYKIDTNSLIAGEVGVAFPGDEHIGHAGPHYGSITVDTNGYLWVVGRAGIDANGRLATWVSRTAQPYDIAKWQPLTVIFESAGPGAHAPQIIALGGGRVACVLFAKYEKKSSVKIERISINDGVKEKMKSLGYIK